jgi:holo-[acyl-carrier protein] synthase
MITGIGTDISDTASFNAMTRKQAGNWFSPDEVDYCFRKQYPNRHLAARWSAKEAAIKALGLTMAAGTRNIVVVLSNNVPHLEFKGKLEPYNDSHKFHMSMSHTNCYATATVIVETKPAEK